MPKRQNMTDLDGAMFFNDADLNVEIPATDQDAEGLWGEVEDVVPEAGHLKSSFIVIERVVARWKDPTSPPHVRKKCAKWMKVKFPKAKVCIGWKLQYRWIYRTATLRVTGQAPDIRDAVSKCLTESAIVAAFAAIVSGGSAAAPAAAATFKSCIQRRLANDLVDVQVSVKTVRGGWE